MDTNENINNEVSFTDSQTESQINSDSGIQTESLSISDSNVDGSVLISEVGANSTPITTKTNIKEKELSLEDTFYFMKTNFSKVNSNFNKQRNDFDEKFDKIDRRFDVKLNEQNDKIKSNFDDRFNEIRDEIKQENFKLSEQVNVTNTNFNNMKEQIIKSINNNCEKMVNEVNKNLDRKLNQIMNKKLDDNVTNISNDKIVEENKILNSDEIEIVSESERVRGVEISVDELEKEWQERLDEYVGQRANFPQVYGETEVSQVVDEDRVSSSSYVGDMVSQNGPLVFCDLAGKARRCNKYFVWPFAWSEIVQGGSDRCYVDER